MSARRTYVKLEYGDPGMALSYQRVPYSNPFPNDPLPAFGGAAESDAKQESLWKIIDDRMRGRWKYACMIGLGLAAVLGIGGYFSASPMFQGMGAIEIKPNPGVVVNETTERMDMRENYHSFVATQMHYIKNDRCLKQALEDEELVRIGFSKNPAALKTLKKGLTVEPDRDSRLVFVTFDSVDPQLAQAVTNAVLRAYYDLYGKKGGQNVNSTLETVANFVRMKERDLRSFRTQRDQVMRDYETTDLKALQASHMQRIGEMEAQLALAKRIMARHTPSEAGGAADIKRAPTAAQLETFNPYLASVRSERDAAQLAFDSIKEVRLAESDVYKDRMQKADRAQKLYAAEYQKTLLEWEVKGGDATLMEVGREPITAADVADFEKELATLKLRQAKLTKDLAHIENLTVQEAQAQKLMETYQSRMNELETEQGELMSTISVAMEASRPDEPHEDARRKHAVIGVGLGLMASFGTFFLLGSVDRRAFGSSQLHNLGSTSMPACLGVLPDLGASLTDPDSSDVASHCVHQIRNQIEAVRKPDSGYILAITSPFQGDGKTSIVMALGWSYAAAGYNTLLVDCDMVGRSLTRQLGLVGREGLKDALMAQELNGSVARLPVEHLSAVPVGVDNRYGPENVRRIDLQRLLDHVRTEYDIILVDTGPMLGSLESTPVTAIADGVVLSVRRGRSRSRLEDCVHKLEVMGTRCLGIILNCAVRSDCNRYVSEASLAAAEEERATRADAVDQTVIVQPAPGERNALVRAVQTTTRTRAGA
jgi:polysaccharide biosynthesis transport protein